MKFILSFQNLTQLFWTTVIALKLYAVLLIYRVAIRYRVERIRKLCDTQDLKHEIELRSQHRYKDTVEAACPHQPFSNLTVNNVTDQKTEEDMNKYSPLTSNQNLSKALKMNSTNRTSKANGVHSSHAEADVDCDNMLYISDSFGRVIQQIPFSEHDYREAYNHVIIKNRNCRKDGRVIIPKS